MNNTRKFSMQKFTILARVCSFCCTMKSELKTRLDRNFYFTIQFSNILNELIQSFPQQTSVTTAETKTDEIS